MLKQIDIKDIDTGKRARKDLGDVEELKNSIEKRNLINPITLFDKEAADDWEDHDLKNEEKEPERRYLLMAGGRRLTAWNLSEKLGKEIPANVYDRHLSAKEIKSIELIENIQRKELDHKEEMLLTRQIHKLQQDIKGEVEGSGRGKTGHSARDTAKLLGRSAGSVSEDLRVAEAMEAVPELFENTKNKTEAKKIYKKTIKEIEDEEKAQEIKEKRATTSEDKLKKQIADKYILKDVMEGLRGLDNGVINIMEVDPPLAIGFEDIYDEDTSYKDSLNKENYIEKMTQLLDECYRVMKKNSWIIVWYPIEPYHQTVLGIMKDVGFKVRGIPLIWDKQRAQTASPKYNLGNGYEVALYGRKGTLGLNRMGHSNVFSWKTPMGKERYHKTEKPIELYEEIFDTFGRKGHTVCTAYAGSGNGILAAENIDMTAFGFDISEDYKNKFDLKAHSNIPPNYSSYE